MTEQRLAERPDLYRLGIKAVVIASIVVGDQDSCLDSASVWLLGMLGGRYARPWQSWEDDVRSAVCKYAAYDLLCMVGYNPAAGADVNIRTRREDAERWAISVARQEISPLIVGAIDQSPTFDAPRILGKRLQGWPSGSVQ